MEQDKTPYQLFMEGKLKVVLPPTWEEQYETKPQAEDKVSPQDEVTPGVNRQSTDLPDESLGGTEKK